MKCLTACLAGLVVLGSSAVFGEDPAPRERGEREPGALFERMDANKDGFIVADEVGERGARMFERLKTDADKNEDGKISREEFDATMAQRRRPGGEGRPGAEGRPGQRPEGRPGMQFSPEAMLERMDANKDGKISKEEAPERMREGFNRLDTNTDGFIDAAELKALAERFQQRRPEGQDGPRREGQDAPRRRPNPEAN